MERDRIADLTSHHGSLISLYARRPSPGGFAALLSDLLKPIRERAAGFDRGVEKGILRDVTRIHDLAAQLEFDSAPGCAVFASDRDDIFALELLGYPPPNVATIGPRPYMRPLRAEPRGVRSGILLADHAQARTFVAMEGIVDELKAPLGADIGNRSWGGFSGYEEQNVRSRADEITAKLWREAGERLLDSHMNRPFDYLAIGGHEETRDEMGRNLHPYLDQLPRATFTFNPRTMSMSALRVEVAAMDRQMREQRQSALVGRVCDTAWSGGSAVLGLQETIDAANAQAVDTLVVAGPFSRSGLLCDSCGHLTRSEETCPVCRATPFPVDDIVGAVMESVVAAGGAVRQVSVASPLDRYGVGALTRFPVTMG